jgi:multidrug efflux pump
MKVKPTSGPERVVRYNSFLSADINGGPAPGYSSGEAQAAIERIAAETLPKGIAFEWTDLTYQQIIAGHSGIIIFPLALLLVFLVLAAQYESLALPIAIILIVEFARELELAGRSPKEAAIEASRLRLRPILMTSMAFIMGVVPLVTSTGAGAEMRSAMGIAVFAGMIGVTAFGIFLTPVFYVVVRRLGGNRPLRHTGEATITAASDGRMDADHQTA